MSESAKSFEGELPGAENASAGHADMPAGSRQWRRPLWITAVLVAGLVVVAVWPRSWEVVLTPSGHRVTHIVLAHFVVPNESPVLQLRYETTFPLTDTLALRDEARELWGRFRYDVARGGYVNAAFLAQSPPTGFCFRYAGYCHYHSYGFLAQKHADGQWYIDGDARPLP